VKRVHIGLIAGAVVLAAGVTSFVVYASQPETHTCTGWLETKGYDPEGAESLICVLGDAGNSELTEEEFNSLVTGGTNQLEEAEENLED